MALQATARTEWFPKVEFPAAVTQPALEETIKQTLDAHFFAIVTGLKVDEKMQASFQELAAAFSRLKKPTQGVGDFFETSFLNRCSDMGEFAVSDEFVKPYKGNRLGTDLPAYVFKNEALYENPFLQSLVQFAWRALPGLQRARLVNVVLTRHDTSVEALEPHQDNGGNTWNPNLSHYVVQFAINRSPEGIKGGEIQIVMEGSHVLAQKLFKDPMDCYFVCDNVYSHGATEITIEKEGSVRDVLIMRFKRGTIFLE